MGNGSQRSWQEKQKRGRRGEVIASRIRGLKARRKVPESTRALAVTIGRYRNEKENLSVCLFANCKYVSIAGYCKAEVKPEGTQKQIRIFTSLASNEDHVFSSHTVVFNFLNFA